MDGPTLPERDLTRDVYSDADSDWSNPDWSNANADTNLDGDTGSGRQIITGMLVDRTDVLEEMAAHNTRIYVRDDFAGIAEPWLAYVPAVDRHCGTFIHEFAHVIDHAIDAQAGGDVFDTRLRALYQAAVNAGRWRGHYAGTSVGEYWAEVVKFWLWETMPASLAASYPTVKDYDPEVVEFLEEVLGDATIPASCKP